MYCARVRARVSPANAPPPPPNTRAPQKKKTQTKGNTPADIGSGNEYVHNTLLYDHVEKAVLRAPFTYAPRPMWSANQTGNDRLMPAAFRFVASMRSAPTAMFWLHFVAYYALRGSWRHGRGNTPAET